MVKNEVKEGHALKLDCGEKRSSTGIRLAGRLALPTPSTVASRSHYVALMALSGGDRAPPSKGTSEFGLDTISDYFDKAAQFAGGPHTVSSRSEVETSDSRVTLGFR